MSKLAIKNVPTPNINKLEIMVHELEIEKRQLIPNGRKNCHCLQQGMKPGSIILLTKTKAGREWLIFFPSKEKSLLHALTHLSFFGIDKNLDDDQEEIQIVAVRAESIAARGYADLREMLLNIKNPELNLEEIYNEETREISAFYLS
jgi:hypothetical protein